MSKRIILAKVTQDDLYELTEAAAIVNTYRTLLLNQFLHEDQIEEIKKKIDVLIEEYESKRVTLFKKYNIPSISPNTLKTDFDNNTLYVEISE